MKLAILLAMLSTCVQAGDAASFAKRVEKAIERQQALVIDSATDLTDLASPIIVAGPLTIVGNHSTLTGPATDFALFELHSGASVVCRGVDFQQFSRVFNCNVGDTPYDIDIRDCSASDIGSGIIGSGAGVYCRFGSVRIQDCDLSGMGQTVGHPKAYAIDVSASELGSAVIDGVTIDGVASLKHTSEAGGVRVDCSRSTDKAQSVLITDCIVRNVASSTSTGTDQVVGVLALECAATISNCIVDTVTAPNHTSSPEAIYTKCSRSIVSGNKVLDVIGTEACINLKGELSGTGSAERSLVSGNVISFRKPIGNRQCVGIACSAPGITVTGNLIEGTNVGVITGFDGTAVTNNVFRDIGSTAVELIPGGKAYSYTITDNLIERSTYGLMATCAGTSSVESLIFSGNTLRDVRFGLQVLHLSNTKQGTIQAAGNTIERGKAAFVVISDRFRKVDCLELSGNSMRGTNPLVTNTDNGRVCAVGNVLNGEVWE